MPDQDWSSVESLTTLYKSCKVLCGRHFQDSCYIDSNKKRLSKFAVPGTRDYVSMQLNSLRSKIPSIVQQMVIDIAKLNIMLIRLTYEFSKHCKSFYGINFFIIGETIHSAFFIVGD